jgi:hypothetical protein
MKLTVNVANEQGQQNVLQFKLHIFAEVINAKKCFLLICIIGLGECVTGNGNFLQSDTLTLTGDLQRRLPHISPRHGCSN